jgi:hypothetical protein
MLKDVYRAVRDLDLDGTGGLAAKSYWRRMGCMKCRLDG